MPDQHLLQVPGEQVALPLQVGAHRVLEGQEHLVPAKVCIGPIGGAQQGEESLHVLLHPRPAQGRQGFRRRGQPVHLLRGKGIVLVPEVRRPRTQIQVGAILPHRPAGGVGLLQKGGEVHAR